MEKLALYGGDKAKKTQYATGKRFDGNELKYLKEALEQDTLFVWGGTMVHNMTKKFAEMYGVNHCVATSSGSAAIHVALGTLGVTEGDEVITTPITDMGSIIGILYQNAIPVFADVDPYTYNIDPKSIEEKITDKTKAIILNSPSNPTGAVMEKEDIKAIADLSMDHDFLIISDEIYEKIIYDKKHYSPAKYSDNVITINGFSKTYAMTGLRVGYLTANENYSEEIFKIHQNSIACANSTAQKGAIEALAGPQDEVNKMVDEFKKRRNLIVSRLNEMGCETVNAEGAFYVFPKIEDEDFVKKAADAGVITVNGAAFGSNGEGHVRMSYANSYENIEKAMNILEERVVNG